MKKDFTFNQDLTFQNKERTSREVVKKVELFKDKLGIHHPIKKHLKDSDMEKAIVGNEWNNYKILANIYQWSKPTFMDKDSQGRPIICKNGASKEFMDSIKEDCIALGIKVFCNYKTGRVVVEQDTTSKIVLDWANNLNLRNH